MDCLDLFRCQPLFWCRWQFPLLVSSRWHPGALQFSNAFFGIESLRLKNFQGQAAVC
jgi:hypothetical protein